MTHIVSKPDHGAAIGAVEGGRVLASPDMQRFMDDLMERLNKHLLGDRVIVPEYTVATVPSAVTKGWIFVSDETGGATMAFADGTNWRRVQDRAIIS